MKKLLLAIICFVFAFSVPSNALDLSPAIPDIYEDYYVIESIADRPLTFRFSNLQYDGDPEFIWIMEDGTTYDGREATHEYAKPGIYKVYAIAISNSLKNYSVNELTVYANLPEYELHSLGTYRNSTVESNQLRTSEFIKKTIFHKYRDYQQIYALAKFNHIDDQLSVEFKWIKPSGDQFDQPEIDLEKVDNQTFCSAINIGDISEFGRWQVQIFVNNVKIDEEFFVISPFLSYQSIFFTGVGKDNDPFEIRENFEISDNNISLLILFFKVTSVMNILVEWHDPDGIIVDRSELTTQDGEFNRYSVLIQKPSVNFYVSDNWKAKIYVNHLYLGTRKFDIKSKILLSANFDIKLPGAPETGGPIQGEPSFINQADACEVMSKGLLNNHLVINDYSQYKDTIVRFDFNSDAKIKEGKVIIEADIMFDSTNSFSILAYGISTEEEVQYLNLTTNRYGELLAGDKNHFLEPIAEYQTNRFVPLKIIFDMDQRTYSIWYDNVNVVKDFIHGIESNIGINNLYFRVSADNDLIGQLSIDNILVYQD